MDVQLVLLISLFFCAYSNARNLSAVCQHLHEVTESVNTCVPVKHQLEDVETK
jgi:hypothetical protein